MHRRLFAGRLNFFVCSLQFSDPQIVFNAVMEEVGFLGNKALHLPQICSVDLVDGRIRNLYLPLLNIPEPHEKF